MRSGCHAGHAQSYRQAVAACPRPAAQLAARPRRPAATQRSAARRQLQVCSGALTGRMRGGHARWTAAAATWGALWGRSPFSGVPQIRWIDRQGGWAPSRQPPPLGRRHRLPAAQCSAPAAPAARRRPARRRTWRRGSKATMCTPTSRSRWRRACASTCCPCLWRVRGGAAGTKRRGRGFVVAEWLACRTQYRRVLLGGGRPGCRRWAAALAPCLAALAAHAPLSVLISPPPAPPRPPPQTSRA